MLWTQLLHGDTKMFPSNTFSQTWGTNFTGFNASCMSRACKSLRWYSVCIYWIRIIIISFYKIYLNNCQKDLQNSYIFCLYDFFNVILFWQIDKFKNKICPLVVTSGYLHPLRWSIFQNVSRIKQTSYKNNIGLWALHI